MQIEDFMSTLKPFTKIFIFGSLAIGSLVSLGILHPGILVMKIPQDLYNPLKYLTSIFFMGGIKMNTLTNLLFAYYTLNGSESSYLPNRYGDFIYMLLILLFGNNVS